MLLHSVFPVIAWIIITKGTAEYSYNNYYIMLDKLAGKPVKRKVNIFTENDNSFRHCELVYFANSSMGRCVLGQCVR